MLQTRLLTLGDVATRLGIGVDSVRVYHQNATKRRREGSSRPGDMPPPDEVFARSPVWTLESIEAWEARRPGRGNGGPVKEAS